MSEECTRGCCPRQRPILIPIDPDPSPAPRERMRPTPNCPRRNEVTVMAACPDCGAPGSLGRAIEELRFGARVARDQAARQSGWRARKYSELAEEYDRAIDVLNAHGRQQAPQRQHSAELAAGRLVVAVLRRYAAHHEQRANPAISTRVRECLAVLPPEWSDHDTGERT